MLITPENVPVQDWELRLYRDGPLKVHSHVPLDGVVVVLFFDVGHVIELPASIFKAELVLGITRPAGFAGEISVATIITPWLKGPLSWSEPWSVPGMAPDADYEPPRAVPFVTPDDGSLLKVKVDVTDDLRRWMTARLPNLGWRLMSSASFGSAHSLVQAAQPTLSVKYSDGARASFGAGISMGVI